MKFQKKIITAVTTALMVVSSCVTPYSGLAFVPDTEYIVSENKYATDSIQEAGEQVRALLKLKETDVNVYVSPQLITSKADINKILEIALQETGVADEGDYIRWGMRSYKYSASFDSSIGAYDVNFIFDYNTTLEQEEIVTQKVNAVIEELNIKDKSEYEKIKAVYDYVVKNVAYSEESEDRAVFSAYGALVNGTAVCQGNAQLVYRLLTEVGVSSRFIPGKGNGGNHAWNIAGLDGTYYYIDTTWDSDSYEDGYHYFLRGTDDMDELSPANEHSAEQWGDTASPLYADYEVTSFSARYPISPTAYVMPTYTLGDVNGDGLIDAGDSSLILAEYANISVANSFTFNAEQRAVADVDGDEKIDASDASFILSYYSYASTGGELSFSEFIQTL